ncbi:MAG: AAA family ATPase [Marmoricola sp.]|nr:AAA family ATPase [Marmoricola sp.]
MPRRAAPATGRAEVFVGRERELAALEQARRDARAGPVVVLVDGEPGLGKSTLLRRFAGDTAAWGRHPDHDVAPALWSWQQVLTQVVRDHPAVTVPDSVARLLDGSGTATRAHEAEGARLRFFDDVVALLGAAAPLEVVLDDLHAADTASLRLLEHVAATGVPGLLLVATYRTHEAASLGPTLAALARTDSRRIGLAGLAPEAVRALVADVSGREPDAAEAVRLQERTGGNPFFVVEVARSHAEVPDAVRDVVLHRIDALGPETAAVLEAAAVVGDRFEAWLAAEVAGTTPDVAARALDRAYDAGLVRDDPAGPGHEFAHALVVDALLGRHSRAWRAVRHERCALALTRAHGGREDRLATIARHWLAAADLGPDRARTAADFCARASRAALARHAAEEAIPLAQEAVAAGELGGSADSERLELHLTLARACYAAGRYDDGYAAALTALATGRPDPEQVVAVADVVMADAMWPPFHTTADPTPLEVALDDAVARLGPGTPAWSLGQACRAVIMTVTGREADIEETSDAAVAVAAGHEDLLTRVLHLQLVSMRGPDFVERRAEVSRLLRARPGVPPTLVLVADLHLASHEVEHGRSEAARRALPDLLRRAEALRDPVLIRQVTQMQVAFLVFAGHHDEALATIAEVAARTSSVDPRYFQAAEATLHVLVALERDALPEMAPLLELVHAETRMSGFGYVLGLAVAETDPDRARRLLAAPPPARDYTWLTSTLVRMRLAIALGDRAVVEECEALFAPFSGQLLVNGTCTCVIGAYDAHLGEAALALGRPAEARRRLEDAVALLEANGAAYWLDRARQVLAKCL